MNLPRIPGDVPAHSFEFPGLRVGVAEYDEGSTTGDVDERELDLSDLAVLASELAWDAVLNCVPPDRAEQTSSDRRP